jgi:hypothetical protein
MWAVGVGSIVPSLLSEGIVARQEIYTHARSRRAISEARRHTYAEAPHVPTVQLEALCYCCSIASLL